MPAVLRFFDYFFRWNGKVIQKAGPIFVSFIGALLVFSFGLTILSLLVSWGIMLVSLNSPQVYFDYPFKEMLGASTYYLGVSASMIIALVPIVFLFLASLALMKRKNVFSGVLSGVLIVLWMISIVVAGAVAIEAGPRIENIYEDINSRLDSTRTFELNPFTSIETADDYDITFLKGDTYTVTAKGFDSFINELVVEQTDNKITLHNEESERCFYFVCDRPSMDVTITLPTLAGINFSLGDSQVDYLGFEDEVLSVDGIEQYFNSGNSRENFIRTTRDRVDDLEDANLRTDLRKDLGRIEEVENGDTFIERMKEIWDRLPK